MPNLQGVAQQFHRQADRLVKRNTDEKGVFQAGTHREEKRFCPCVQCSLDYYRDSAAAVLRLQPVEEETEEAAFETPAESMTWNLDEDAKATAFATVGAKGLPKRK